MLRLEAFKRRYAILCQLHGFEERVQLQFATRHPIAQQGYYLFYAQSLFQRENIPRLGLTLDNPVLKKAWNQYVSWAKANFNLCSLPRTSCFSYFFAKKKLQIDVVLIAQAACHRGNTWLRPWAVSPPRPWGTTWCLGDRQVLFWD